MILVAMLLAASPNVQQPWVEMEGGPAFTHQSGQSGMSSGPLLRFDLGYELSERWAGEVWLTGAMQDAPMHAFGDTAVFGGGVAGRFRMTTFDDADRLGLWAHVGAGWSAPTSGAGAAGPAGFAGALLSWQPFVQRFQVGIEADFVAFRDTIGGALLPTLRCSF
jgi:hypothetical protein